MVLAAYFDWTYGIAPDSEARGRMSWLRHEHAPMRRETFLLCDRDRDVLQHALEPLCDAGLGRAIGNFTGYWDDRCVSAAHALLQLWAAREQGPDPAEPSSPHRTAVTVALHSLPGALPEFQVYIERYLRTHQPPRPDRRPRTRPPRTHTLRRPGLTPARPQGHAPHSPPA
ncbi:hypothetical protein GCM10009837_05430 [Streptomyces durmitorensis]|uniref:Uncharacterized protein n=1 Tax=Streptomyces durmitorensis TaxID=319947 RepID=A0ABY4PN43_9ACTN|nr:hypothetical protein [Streptomyces durmitorensis]UQT54550.1 hypothetical protein M4V62_05245 [Streptomyces durmitorensis]